MTNSTIVEEAKPAGDEETAGLTPEYWAALGRRVAKRMAESWGAEWKSHDFDEVHESWGDHAPTAEYREAHKQFLKPLWDDGKDEQYDLLKRVCREAWQEQLAKELRFKRKSLFIDDVGYSSDDWRLGQQERYLLLQDGTTLSGWLGRAEDQPMFTFKVSCSTERRIRIPADAEFLPAPSEVKGLARTARLVLRRDSSGYRHWLAKRDVHCGYGITLVLPTGHLVRGRYECNLSREHNVPAFYFTLARGIAGEVRCLNMPTDAEYLIEGRAL